MINKPLVCIVDDTADYRFLLEQLFQRYFGTYSVRFFGNGEDFLGALAQLSSLPNLIILDMHMPVLDGHQTLLVLKAHPLYRTIPVVMMSAEASADEINACYEGYANSFLGKPIELSVLKAQLELVCQYWLDHNQPPVAA